MKRAAIFLSLFAFGLNGVNIIQAAESVTTGPAKRQCTPEEKLNILQPATAKVKAVDVRCSITFSKGDIITKELRFVGPQSSGAHVNCGGATIDARTIGRSFKDPIIHVKSEKTQDRRWLRPQSIRIENCTLYGSIRSTGMAINGEGPFLRQSSRALGHTKRAQDAAPHDVVFHNMKIIGIGTIPIYVGPGTTGFKVQNSKFTGVSNSVGIYFDAESGGNAIENSVFEVATKREIIAIDGSAQNRIANNYFAHLQNGGIFLYRNCGEGGTIRHQPPQYNVIDNNEFFYRKFGGYKLTFKRFVSTGSFQMPSVWLGSREGYRPFCSHDKGYNFGSSASDEQLADHNQVTNNRIKKLSVDLMIKDRGDNNIITGNRTIK